MFFSSPFCWCQVSRPQATRPGGSHQLPSLQPAALGSLIPKAGWHPAPSHGSHGISPVRCLWQLQDHRKFTAGETQNVREEAPAVATVWGPSQGDRKAPSLHRQDPDTTREHLGCRWVSCYVPDTSSPPTPPSRAGVVSPGCTPGHQVHQNLWGGTKVGYLCFFKFSRYLLCAHGVEGRHLGK